MNDRLAVISTKNPRKDILLKTIKNLKTLYDEFDIVIIDSDSDDKSAFYTVVILVIRVIIMIVIILLLNNNINLVILGVVV